MTPRDIRAAADVVLSNSGALPALAGFLAQVAPSINYRPPGQLGDGFVLDESTLGNETTAELGEKLMRVTRRLASDGITSAAADAKVLVTAIVETLLHTPEAEEAAFDPEALHLAEALEQFLSTGIGNSLPFDAKVPWDANVDFNGHVTEAVTIEAAGALADTVATKSIGNQRDYLIDWAAAVAYSLIVIWLRSSAEGDKAQPVLSVEADEAASFEALWAFIEQASDTGNVPDAVEEQLRRLREMRQIAENLPLGGDELREHINDELAKLLPDLARDWAGDPSLEVPRTVELAAQGAPDSEQLEAIVEENDRAAATLSGLADALEESDAPPGDDPEVPEPYAAATLESVQSVAERVDATAAALTRSFEAIDRALERLSSTRTGRFFLRNAAVAVAGATGPVALAAAGSPINLSVVQAMVILKVGNWIYTRIRRRSGRDLPPRNSAPPSDPDDGTDGDGDDQLE